MSNKIVSLIRLLSHGQHREYYGGHHGAHHDRHHGYDHHYEEHEHRHGHHYFTYAVAGLARGLFDRLRRNRRLLFMTLFGVLAAGVLLLAGVVWLGGKLIALASPLLADINRDGLKSVAEALTTAINRIWEGSGK